MVGGVVTAEEVTNLIARIRTNVEFTHYRPGVDELLTQAADALERSTAETRDRDATITAAEQIMDDANHADLCGCSEWPSRCVSYGDKRPWSYSHEAMYDALVQLGAVSSVVAEDPKPFVMRDLTNRASGLWPKESPAEDPKPEPSFVATQTVEHARGNLSKSGGSIYRHGPDHLAKWYERTVYKTPWREAAPSEAATDD